MRFRLYSPRRKIIAIQLAAFYGWLLRAAARQTARVLRCTRHNSNFHRRTTKRNQRRCDVARDGSSRFTSNCVLYIIIPSRSGRGIAKHSSPSGQPRNLSIWRFSDECSIANGDSRRPDNPTSQFSATAIRTTSLARALSVPFDRGFETFCTLIALHDASRFQIRLRAAYKRSREKRRFNGQQLDSRRNITTIDLTIHSVRRIY